jgi:DNA-binding transcriptional LysR family regulator
MDVHLRNLRYFVAVAEEGSVTRAAERLHVSQPALSKQIRLLERDLGFALFSRDNRAISLTTAGEELLGPARDLLAAWSAAVRDTTLRAREAEALLCVGFLTSVAGGLYKDAAAAFTDEHDGWRIALRLHPWSDATAGLLDGSSDVAFVWLPLPEPERLAWRVLREEPRHVALWPDHPLAAKEELSLEDLLDEPFVALPRSAGVARDYWLATAERGGRPVKVGAQAGSPDAAFEAVAARQGVVLLAAGNAQRYARPEIVSRPVVDISPSELAVAWRAGDDRAVVRDFVDAARRAVS